MIGSVLYNDFSHLENLGFTGKKVVSYPEDLKDVDILIFHGGEDISPSIYNQTAGSHTYARNEPSKRDVIEINIFREAVKRKIPILGICRGAQLTTALVGGSLIQDVTNHTSSHTITTNDGKQMEVTSAHHQMCNPTGTNHNLLAWSTTNRSKHYLGEKDENVHMAIEPEVIFYPDIKALAVQPHPEWMPESAEFIGYLLKQIEERML